MRRKLARVLLYVSPLLLGIGVLLLIATDLGDYQRSWSFSIRMLCALTPNFPALPPDTRTLEISMYQLNEAGRRAAHVIVYTVLSLLVVRALQWGRPRLRVGTLPGMLAFCGLLTGAESVVRLNLATERHVRWEQLSLNLIGTGIAFVLTLIFFGVKALERRTQQPEPQDETE